MLSHGRWAIGVARLSPARATAAVASLTATRLHRTVTLAKQSQAPGGPSEDPTRGFKFGGWVMPYFDEVCGEEVDRVFTEKFDLLLGRNTYEIFAAYWPYYDTLPTAAIATLFNGIKKFVVSRSGDVDTSWRGSVLLRDIADVQRVREEAGPNLVTQGSTELVQALLASDFVDGITIAHYERGGEIKVADTALAEPSQAEVARQDRMKREGWSLSP